MEYQFILYYQSTNSETVLANTCHPLYGDDLSVTIDRENSEWYYKRKLDGKITFVRGDYNWIMSQPFDGTFTIMIQYSNDGTSWLHYFDGTFSRANLEIDEDNHRATLTGLIEGVYNAIENGKDEDYDLMKIIPDSDAKGVQGQVPMALALVDECSVNSKPAKSDVFLSTPFVAGGYKKNVPSVWAIDKDMSINANGRLQAIVAEAKLETDNPSSSLNGNYAGIVTYDTLRQHGSPTMPDFDFYKTSLVGTLYNNNRDTIVLSLWTDGIGSTLTAYFRFQLPNNTTRVFGIGTMYRENTYYSPISIEINPTQLNNTKLTVRFHYIYSSFLLQSDNGVNPNILSTGPYYHGIRPYNDHYLNIVPSTNTVDMPNGHRLLPGTGEQGTTPQYYAPPDDEHNYIPLSESNWDFASLWYTYTPPLLDDDEIGSFRWTRCWELGTVLRYLLNRITGGKVIFTEDTTSSQFLYATVNPVNGHEQFDYLITQKSNVMNPGDTDTAESAARCIVRLNWFLKFLRNALNCYYWLEKLNDGRYLFRVEHVEYCRRGGQYYPDLSALINLPALKPLRNFPDKQGQPAKSYADQTNSYKYDLEKMVEKYTFAWQGEGGSDAFKGNPMLFKAGWVEPSSSEDHQVDNIFVDLNWLMLNAGTDTESGKNYAGVFMFSGYNAWSGQWKENWYPNGQTLTLASGSINVNRVNALLCITIPEGQTISLKLGSLVAETYTGTGSPQIIIINTASPQAISLDFGEDYTDIIIHRIHSNLSAPLYRVPNTPDLLAAPPAMPLLQKYLQNGPLAWPWLLNEHLHYDIPANKWTYKYETVQEANAANDWEDTGTVKMVQKQEIAIFPMPEKSTEDRIMAITGIRTSIEGGKTGIITTAKVNLSSRDAKLSIVYDPVPQGK